MAHSHPSIAAFLGGLTPDRSRKFHFHHLHGVAEVRSFISQTAVTILCTMVYGLINSQSYLKLNCGLQGDCRVTNSNQSKVTNTSNLSLDRDPTGGSTNSREIQRGTPTCRLPCSHRPPSCLLTFTLLLTFFVLCWAPVSLMVLAYKNESLVRY
jgi:hypothetical protein